MLAKILKSRTVIAAIVLTILSVLQGFVFLLPLTPVQQMWVGIVLAVVIVILRAITTSPLWQKGE